MRKFRISIALIVFCLVSAKFFDVYSALPKSYYMYCNPISTQFAPSLLKMMAYASLTAGAAFVTFTLFALLFGRAYCSFFCLFGILMDIVRKLAIVPSKIGFLKNTRAGKFCRKNFALQKFAKARNIARISFLTIAAISLVFGYASLFGLIEPYSLYGKIMGDVVHPAACLAVNETSQMLYSFEIFSIRPVNGDPTIPLAAFSVALFILAAISVATAFRGRIFCNTICPVGTFLGFFANFSLFKISIDRKKCVSCGMCERLCKSQCIDSKNKNVDFSRCVLCFDCAGVCNKNAIGFVLNPKLKKSHKVGETAKVGNADAFEKPRGEFSASRRALPRLALGLSALFCLAAKKEYGKGRGLGLGKQGGCKNPPSEDATPFSIEGSRPDKRLTMPPGAQSMENFLEHCSACQMCTAACKAHILKPSLGELGLAGFMQPYMDFQKGYCIHNCHECSKVCPTGAIKFIAGKEKRHTKIGTAIFRRGLCVVKTDGTDCAACAEHCPVHAIEMLPFGKKEDSLYIPHVHSEVCIGCGACEFICPVRPHKAIVVQGIKRHTKAVVFEESMRLYKPEEKSSKASNADATKSAKPSPSSATNGFPF